MITLEPIRSPAWALRVCPGAREGDPTPPFVASGVIHIDPAEPTVAHFAAFHGDLTRPLLRELLGKLLSIGVTHVHSLRADGHGLPFSVPGMDGVLVIDLVALADRVNKQHRT